MHIVVFSSSDSIDSRIAIPFMDRPYFAPLAVTGWGGCGASVFDESVVDVPVVRLAIPHPAL